MARYANEADLTGFLDGDPAPPHPERLLEQACDLVDQMLIGAFYDVDDNGTPTEAGDIAALKTATLYQAVWMAGDEFGKKSQYSSMSTGGTSWSRATGSGDDQRQSPYSPAAWRHLKMHMIGKYRMAVR